MRRVLAPVLTLLLVVGVGAAIFLSIREQRSRQAEEEALAQQAEVTPLEPLGIRVIVALPLEGWLREAATRFNSQERQQGGYRLQVEVIAEDGLSARNNWARGSYDPLPTAWIAESRTWVDQANEAAQGRTGQDIFLLGGRYRAQPIALSPLVWGIWQDAYQSLSSHFNREHISWLEMHEAALQRRWENIGGSSSEGLFRLVVAHPRRDPAGLTAMVGAAGAYYQKPNVSSEELQDPEFLAWLAVKLDTVVDFSPFGAENMLLFGRSNGDAGQILESYLLGQMESLQNRWEQPLRIIYPDPVAWFDFPYAVYMGPETNATEKEAALLFKEYLLSSEEQAQALEFGLRPACAECPSDGGLIAQWSSVGVAVNVPSSSRMRGASRSGLDALTAWYVASYED